MSLTDTDLPQVQGLAVAVDRLGVLRTRGAGSVQHQGELGQGACGTHTGRKEKLGRIGSGEAKRLLAADAAISAQSGGKRSAGNTFKISMRV